MRLFGGRSARDRDHLLQTLRTLRSTSVAGLAAALSWSERRTERMIHDALRRGSGAVRFDPQHRAVSWGLPEAARPAARSEPTRAPEAAPSAVSAPVLPKSWAVASTRCPSCGVAYESTGTGDHLYCPQCGRLTVGRVSPGRASEPAPSLPAPPTPPSASVQLGPDRRSQELFAAWVTAQPIPCPKCRTPLRHHGVAEYACPSCGARVAFDRSAGLPTSSASPGPSAPTAPALGVAPNAP